MDSPLSAQLQQAWLLAQLSRESSPSPAPTPKIEPFSPSLWNSPAFHPSLDYPSPPLPLHDFSQTSPDLASGASFDSHYLSSTDANGAALPAAGAASSDSGSSSGGAPGPSATDSWGSIENRERSASDMSSFEDDIPIKPSLEYISDILMDEQMEDRLCMRQECIAYQAILNGFYDIVDDKSFLTSSCTDRSTSPEVNEPADYKWVDEILVTDSTSGEQTAVWDSTCSSTGSPEPDAGFQPLCSSSESSSFSQESLAFAGILQNTGSRNGVLNPNLAPGPAQEYLPSSVSNSSTSCFLPASEFPALHNIFYPSDSGVESRFGPEVTSQTFHRNHSEDEKFSGVRSKSLHVNTGEHRSQMNGTTASVSGGQRRTKSSKSTEWRRQPQKEAKSFRITDHGGTRISDRLSGAPGQDVGEVRVKKADSSNGFPIHTNGEGCTPFYVSDDKLSFVKNEKLKAEMIAAKMYGEWSPEDLDNKYRCQKLETTSNGTSAKRAAMPDAVDLRGLLVSCAQAMAGNDVRKANGLLQEIRQHSSPTGSGTQRLAHYFAEGLMARLSGEGARLYTAISNNSPSAAKMLHAYRHSLEFCPFVKISHYFANQNILKAAEGASRLHIVDFGILYGIQWPCLISALANRKGGPPLLRITGIEFPQPGLYPTERVEETGRRLEEYAREYNVPFEYNAIASQWEDVEPSSLRLQKGEVLALNCVHRLRHLLDETVVSSSPRCKVLSSMRSINPDILVLGVLNAGFNAPFFVTRFREALYHFSSKFDMNDTVVSCDSLDRIMVEREMLGRDILNVVACEGPERVERPETCRQWQARFQRAGFELLPVDKTLLSKARAVVRCVYHSNYGVDEDSKWMMLGWKGRVLEGLSAWKPSTGASKC